MSDRFPFLQNNDITGAWERFDYSSDVAYSDSGFTITAKNFDHMAFLLEVNSIESTTISKKLCFWACSGVDGSDATLIEPIYFRQKDLSDATTWTAVETVADGYFDISDGGHCTSTEDKNYFLFEFEAQEIYNEGIAAGDNIVRDCIKPMIISIDTDSYYCYMTGTLIMHPLRYIKQNDSSFDNRTD